MRRFAPLALLFACFASAQVPLDRYDCLQWRCIGPYRGGRTVGGTGVVQQPNVFYIGANNGGVWKTNDYGRTWKPIFDDQPTGSIGNLAVAPSNPNVIYVGSGEGLQRPDLSVGDGMYKSTDAGKTWAHLGLRDGQQINTIIVDPKNPERLFVAVIGHPYGPNEERGVFRSLDGGKSFQKVLYKDPDTGAVALAFDPKNPNTVYADLWAARQGPWENGTWTGPNSGLFKSTDGGNTWHALTKGLPARVGRIGFDVSRSNPKRLFATVGAPEGAGIYRSDDGGESWTFVTSEGRIIGRSDDFAEIRIHPKNPDILFAANTSTYRSDNGGKDWVCIKGSPGGDDYHTIWINPDNPDIICLASDQGACISVNYGETWSSWYNQPTAQFYHVSTDNLFPYNVMAGQQESGSAIVSSRGNDGQITFREWHPAGAEEYGYCAADPLNPDLIYGGKLTRYHKSTGQVDNVRPSGAGRTLRTAPVVFSPVDPHVLFFAGSMLCKTSDGAQTWETISPDLSRESAPPPEGSVFQVPGRRGVIYTVAPSYQKIDTIWAGTDDGLVHVTRDGGKNWTNVTPPGLTPWSKVSIIDAGRFDDDTAYAAVNRIRLDDMHPHIYRTHDGGKTWKEIVRGLPNDPVNTVREDPVVKGLLYCGTERAVYFSTDDGANWNPLRLNMPATSVRDLVVHGDDIVVGTHGRGFWILDNIWPVRDQALGETYDSRSQQTRVKQSRLYTLAPQYLVEWNRNTDTPLPPEEPAGKNPPDGAVIDYYVAREAIIVTLEILDASGKSVRKFSSEDKPPVPDPKAITVMTEWARPPQILGKSTGAHRFVWDMHSASAGDTGRRGGLGMAAIWHDTPFGARGPMVAPGTYTIRLRIDGTTEEMKLVMKADPRTGR
ncbi:MAG: glycoside hydrolase [Fimbriimonadales bacterium]